MNIQKALPWVCFGMRAQAYLYKQRNNDFNFRSLRLDHISARKC